MSKFMLSNAMGNIPDDMLMEAMEVKKHTGRKWILRVAACAAVLAILLTALLWPSEENYITGPGLIKVYAHEIDEAGNVSIDSVVLEEGVEFTSTVVYDPTKSYRQHFPFSFMLDEDIYPGMDITMEVSTNAGIFYKNDPYDPNMPALPAILQIFGNYYGQHFTVGIDKKLYWEPEGFDYAYMAEQIQNGNLDFNNAYKAHDYVINPSFIDVIFRADKHIVGYCVIAIREINENDDHPDREFSFELLTIVNFPEVDGRFQRVSEKYVKEQIESIHNEQKEDVFGG